jgi:MmyB-like transcription regulator ligand binding domain
VRPHLQRVLDHLTGTPAIVLGRNMDILAWNPLAAALITDFSQIPESQRNYLRLVFTHPTVRRLYPDWGSVVRLTVAFLRMADPIVRPPLIRPEWAGRRRPIHGRSISQTDSYVAKRGGLL